MRPLRVVVVERDRQQRLALVAALRAHAVEQIVEPDDCEEALRSCAANPTDLILCNPPDGIRHFTELLPVLGDLRRPPAIAFHGPLANVSRLETQCQRFGLRYLGHLVSPVSADRLDRMVKILRNLKSMDGHSERTGR